MREARRRPVRALGLGPGLDFLERTFPEGDFSGLRARWNVLLRARGA
ncbi:hypothetical protein ACL02R_01660 [Streptomyces sp. MS19]